MKKLFTTIIVLTLIGASFYSCKKDDASISNSLTITGTFTIGDKVYTNPTFNLGGPEQHMGYLNTANKASANSIHVEPWDIVELGNNVFLNYNFEIYTAVSGPEAVEMFTNLNIYLGGAKSSSLFLYSNNATAIVSKVGAVDDYIEFTFEGDFYEVIKKTVLYHINGTFKVKHTLQPGK